MALRSAPFLFLLAIYGFCLAVLHFKLQVPLAPVALAAPIGAVALAFLWKGIASYEKRRIEVIIAQVNKAQASADKV